MKIGVFATFLVLLGFVQPAFSERSCHDWTPAEWDQNIADKLASSYSITIQLGGQLDDWKRDCYGQIKALGLDACLERLDGYVHQFKGGNFSNVMTDEEYYKSEPQDVMTLPPELENASNGLPKDWKKLAAKKGWKWVHFHSDTAQEPRLVIFMPGTKYDRLLVYYDNQMSPPNQDATSKHPKPPKVSDPTHYAGLQMQAIEKQPEGADLPKYYFRSWGFTGSNSHPVTRVSGGRCVSCHLNGPRAVVPRKDAAFSTEMGGVKDLAEFNSLIVQTRRLDYSPYYDLKNFPVHMKLGELDQCTECHDGQQRNSLAFSVDSYGSFFSENIHRKVEREKTMPKNPWNELSDEDRETIAFRLSTEYRVKLSAWLTETKCVNAKPGQPIREGGSAPNSNSSQ